MSAPDLEKTDLNPKQLLLQGLEMRWENYQTELKNCRDEFSEDSVHDLRVATRRMLALIQLLKSISPRPRLKKMARAFKDQLDEFDNLRDTQVILGELSEVLHEIPDLEDFEKYLRSYEEQMMQDLRTRLKDRNTSGIEKWIHKTKEEIETWGADAFQTLILDAVDEAYLIVRQRLGWVDLARSSTIHRVRVAFKAFRYMVEIVHPLLPGFPRGILKEMNEYQTLMGNIQDVEVFAQTLANFAKDEPFPDLEAVHRYYERRRSQAISTFASEKDHLESFWRSSPNQPFPWE